MMKIPILAILLMIETNTWGHGGEDHSKSIPKPIQESPDQRLVKKYERINSVYIEKIRPIFLRACLDCHGSSSKFPWYYKIPGIKQLIDYDVSEAKKHLDFSKNFPFKSHETPLRDFDAILKTIKDGSMPPFRYRVMHRDSKLTEGEVLEVEGWIKNSREILND